MCGAEGKPPRVAPRPGSSRHLRSRRTLPLAELGQNSRAPFTTGSGQSPSGDNRSRSGMTMSQ